MWNEMKSQVCFAESYFMSHSENNRNNYRLTPNIIKWDKFQGRPTG